MTYNDVHREQLAARYNKVRSFKGKWSPEQYLCILKLNINNSAEMQGLNGRERFEHKFRVFAFSNSLLSRQINQLNAAAMSATKIAAKLFTGRQYHRK